MKETRIWSAAIMLTLLAPLTVIAQSGYRKGDLVDFPGRVDLEQSTMEVTYEQTKTDPLNDGKQEVTTMVLQIGPRYSKYYEYSLLQEDLAIREAGGVLERSRWYAICDSVGVKRRYGRLYKDRQENRCQEFAFATGGTYSYDEEIPEIDWQLTGETKEIGGFACQSAECDLRGRHWSVWYAPEIKISEGPYKLMGLPGLILEAHSKDGEIEVTFMGLTKSDNPIIYDKEEYENSFKGSRKDFYRAISRGKWHFSQAMESAGLWATDMEGNPLEPAIKYMPYVPWEMDLVERPKE